MQKESKGLWSASRQSVLAFVLVLVLGCMGAVSAFFILPVGARAAPTHKLGEQSKPKPGTTLFTYRGHTNRVNGVAWSPDGKRIVSGSDDYTVQVWNASNGGNVLAIDEGGLVEAVAWSPDGLHIVEAGGPPDVRDAKTGKLIYTYRGHSLIVYAVAWSPKSLRVASAGADGTVQVWNATTGAHVLVYRGHSNGVNGVAWSPDGKRIASASSDTTVQVWQAA